MKKIMLDARVVDIENKHGIERHTYELVQNIATHKLVSNFEFYILVNKNSKLLRNVFPSNIKLIQLRTGWLSFLGQIELLYYIFKYRPNIFHSPSFMVPFLSRVPFIATVHDMNHVALSKNYSLKQTLYYNFILKWKLKYALAIITVSHFSKSEIVKYLNILERNIYVIYNGISNQFKPKNSFDELKKNKVRHSYSLPDFFLLALGNQKEHKNIPKLIEAYCLSEISTKFVIVSDNHVKNIEIAEKYGKLSHFVFLTHVLDEDFPVLFALCQAFIYPSLYEGFGLPLLEAAFSEVPIAASNSSCIPEIMEDSIVYFNPESCEDIQRALSEILTPHNEKILLNIQKAKLRCPHFSWQRMAEETLFLYSNF